MKRNDYLIFFSNSALVMLCEPDTFVTTEHMLDNLKVAFLFLEIPSHTLFAEEHWRYSIASHVTFYIRFVLAFVKYLHLFDLLKAGFM
jgi:hypothetical protein